MTPTYAIAPAIAYGWILRADADGQYDEVWCRSLAILRTLVADLRRRGFARAPHRLA